MRDRWQALFADVEAQADLLADQEQRGEVSDRTRLERGRLSLTQRLAPGVGHPLAVQLAGIGTVQGTLTEVGVDWLLLQEPGQRDALVPLAAVQSVSGAGRAASPEQASAVARRLDLRWVLRGLARSRAEVVLTLSAGATVTGTLDGVGADHLDVAEHGPGQAPRGGEPRATRLVPLSALVLVRS